MLPMDGSMDTDLFERLGAGLEIDAHLARHLPLPVRGRVVTEAALRGRSVPDVFVATLRERFREGENLIRPKRQTGGRFRWGAGRSSLAVPAADGA